MFQLIFLRNYIIIYSCTLKITKCLPAWWGKDVDWECGVLGVGSGDRVMETGDSTDAGGSEIPAILTLGTLPGVAMPPL